MPLRDWSNLLWCRFVIDPNYLGAVAWLIQILMMPFRDWSKLLGCRSLNNPNSYDAVSWYLEYFRQRLCSLTVKCIKSDAVAANAQILWWGLCTRSRILVTEDIGKEASLGSRPWPVWETESTTRTWNRSKRMRRSGEIVDCWIGVGLERLSIAG
jgi:hypothetical protein